VLGHDPTRRIICVSYSEILTRKHANDFRAVMRSELYQHLFPRCRISSAKDTELEVMTTARGNRYATSVGGTLTGRGGNLLIIDDPMKPQDAQSSLARDNLKDWYSKTLLSRLDSKVNDAIIVVMQRLHVDAAAAAVRPAIAALCQRQGDERRGRATTPFHLRLYGASDRLHQIEQGARFEYKMIVQTIEALNMRRLAEKLRGTPDILEFHLSPTDD
jgi:hypothetical protein